MKGDLTEPMTKGGRSFIRRLNPDVELPLAGRRDGAGPRSRALMLVRNVGHLMTTPAILARRAPRCPRASWTRCSPR